jgi:hypothetical protein
VKEKVKTIHRLQAPKRQRTRVLCQKVEINRRKRVVADVRAIVGCDGKAPGIAETRLDQTEIEDLSKNVGIRNKVLDEVAEAIFVIRT